MEQGSFIDEKGEDGENVKMEEHEDLDYKMFMSPQ